MRESGSSGGQPEQSGGLPLEWSNLEDHRCPRCGEELVEFPHIEMHKCECGFKIGDFRLTQILRGLEDAHSGYRFGNYDDEPPF